MHYNTFACYYYQQNSSCGRNGSPQYQPFYMNTPCPAGAFTYLIERTYRNYTEKRNLCLLPNIDLSL